MPEGEFFNLGFWILDWLVRGQAMRICSFGGKRLRKIHVKDLCPLEADSSSIQNPKSKI